MLKLNYQVYQFYIKKKVRINKNTLFENFTEVLGMQFNIFCSLT